MFYCFDVNIFFQEFKAHLASFMGGILQLKNTRGAVRM